MQIGISIMISFSVFKLRLSDDLVDLKKKLKDEEKFSNDTQDKCARYKDCLYKAKSLMNRALDDISDTFRRDKPSGSLTSSKKEISSLSTTTIDINPNTNQTETNTQLDENPSILTEQDPASIEENKMETTNIETIIKEEDEEEEKVENIVEKIE